MPLNTMQILLAVSSLSSLSLSKVILRAYPFFISHFLVSHVLPSLSFCIAFIYLYSSSFPKESICKEYRLYYIQLNSKNFINMYWWRSNINRITFSELIKTIYSNIWKYQFILLRGENILSISSHILIQSSRSASCIWCFIALLPDLLINTHGVGLLLLITWKKNQLFASRFNILPKRTPLVI